MKNVNSFFIQAGVNYTFLGLKTLLRPRVNYIAIIPLDTSEHVIGINFYKRAYFTYHTECDL